MGTNHYSQYSLNKLLLSRNTCFDKTCLPYCLLNLKFSPSGSLEIRKFPTSMTRYWSILKSYIPTSDSCTTLCILKHFRKMVDRKICVMPFGENVSEPLFLIKSFSSHNIKKLKSHGTIFQNTALSLEIPKNGITSCMLYFSWQVEITTCNMKYIVKTLSLLLFFCKHVVTQL